MPNDRLRDALGHAGVTYVDAATHIGVDPKTVQRWVTADRVPYPRHRNALCALVEESEAYLWPDAFTNERRNELSTSELVSVYPKRSAVPQDLWLRLLNRDAEQIEMLVYAGLFLPEMQADLASILAAKTEQGARVRLLFVDPECDAVHRRGDEEGIGDALAGRVRNTLAYFRAPEAEPLDIRLHTTTLYNSIYRFDDDMLVSAHVYGLAGTHAPVMHLRRIAGGEMFETYRRAYERVWSSSHDASDYL